MDRWHKLVTRRIGVQVAHQWNHSFWRMRKPYGIGIDSTRIVFDGQKTQYFVDAAQWGRFKQGLRKKLKNKAFIHNFARDAERFLEKQSLRIRIACNADFSSCTDGQLQQEFNHVITMADDYYTRMWMVFLINEPLAQTIYPPLKAKAPDYADEMILAFSSPLTPNDAIRERQSLLRIAMEKNQRRRETLLERHARRFAHIPVFDFNHAPYALDHFQKELTIIQNPQNELDRLQDQFRKRRRDVPWLLSKLKLPKNGLEHAQIRMLSTLAHLRDYRDTLRQKMNLSLRNLYGEIARRARMTLSDVSFLSNDEIRTLLSEPSSRTALRQIAQARKKGFRMLETPHGVTISSGKQKSTTRKNKSIGPIRGICANPGEATGPARIVLTNLDLPKIRLGDVMVAPMTRQDFVPYIRRCAALVTDEGGVTCHAAIIARELDLPCIVGTNVATRVMKNGQKVNVDATRGCVIFQGHKNPKKQ